MTQTVTLKLPETIFLPAQRMAKANRQPLAKILVIALQTSLPSLEGLPPDLHAKLAKLERLKDSTLWRIMLSQVPTDKQRKIARLLRKNQSGELTDRERAALSVLQHEADFVMLRKARAAVLLRFRGHRLPTLAELRKLTPSLSR